MSSGLEGTGAAGAGAGTKGEWGSSEAVDVDVRMDSDGC